MSAKLCRISPIRYLFEISMLTSELKISFNFLATDKTVWASPEPTL